MGWISMLFAHKVAAVAAERAPDPAARRRALLAGAGVDPDAPVDPKRMISDDVYYSLCERAARADPDGATLPLRVGDRMRADDYGAFGLAWKSAVDLRGSYQRAERYGRVLTSVSSYTLDLDAGRAFMTLRRDGERRLGLRLSNEQTLVAIVRISREISRRPFAPRAVHFRHPAPGDVAAHEAYFGCPALFGADRDAIELDETALDAPNRLGDPRISEFFDAHLAQELAALAQDEGLERRVRIQIAQALSAGPPTLAEIAARMSMSARTLQRRLAERGCAFQDLADAARRELAERLLRRTDYALAEVAFLTGFSDQSAFTRAFKRWSGGRTPAGFRRDAAAGG